jgi:hypothetical protein
MRISTRKFSRRATLSVFLRKQFYQSARAARRQILRPGSRTKRGGSADRAAACAVVKFVVEGAAEEYDALKIDTNRKFHLRRRQTTSTTAEALFSTCRPVCCGKCGHLQSRLLLPERIRA